MLLSDATEFRSTGEEVFFNPPGTAAIDVIYHLLMTFLPVPVDALLRCGEIAESEKFACIDTDTKEWKRAVGKFAIDILRMTATEVCQTIRSTTNAYFSPFNAYMPINMSVEWLNKWIALQFGRNASLFVSSLWQLLDGASKQNCLWLHGPPNSGKSFVLMSLAESRIIYGTVKNAFSTNNFPFESATKKKLIFLDEFCFDARYEQHFQSIVHRFWPRFSYPLIG